MRKVLLLSTLLLFSFTFAEKISEKITVLSDTSGPIGLKPYFIVPSSVKISPTDSSSLPSYRFFPTSQDIYFESAIDSGTSFTVTYETTRSGVKKDYSLFEKIEYSESEEFNYDSSNIDFATSEESQIKISGEKTIGVSVGGDGSSAIDQSLDVELFGEITKNTKISGHISDQSSSLQGDTKEVGALEKIFLTVENPYWKVSVGDIAITTGEDGIIDKKRNPKGLYGALRNEQASAAVFGGVSGDRVGYDRFVGVAGVQGGIYRLTGAGESGYIWPKAGSFDISVDGEQLSEGEHYWVDYDIGAVNFTASYTIRDDQFIEVHYLYREYEYSKLAGGSNLSFSNHDSSLIVNGSMFADRDDANSSSKLLTPEELETIKNGGDRPIKILSGSKVHPNDVVRESALNRVYSLDTSSSIYLWEDELEERAHILDHYTVIFAASADRGDYLPYSEDNRVLFGGYDSKFLDEIENEMKSVTLEDIYLFVGEGSGTHITYSYPILPENRVEGEIGVVYSPVEELEIDTKVAGRYRDKNSLSSVDESDNNSGAVSSSLYLSTPVEKKLIAAIDIKGNYAGAEFINDLLTDYERFNIWAIKEDSASYATSENRLTFSLKEKVSLFGEYGASFVKNRLNSNNGVWGVNHGTKSKFFQEYKILSREVIDGFGNGYRQNYLNSFNYSWFSSNLLIEQEWFDQEVDSSGGHILGLAEFDLTKVGWKNSVEYKRMRVGKNDFSSSIDSGSSFLWEQFFERDITENYNINLKTSYLKSSKKGEDSTSSMLISISDNAKSTSGRSESSLSLSTNSESFSERRWEYVPVPEGSGTHYKDSITRTFIPSSTGDYMAREIVSFGDVDGRTVRNHLGFGWRARAKTKNRGTDGMEWSGTLSTQEDIFPEKKGVGAYNIPLFTTINQFFITNNVDSLNYSLLSYSQNWSWLPPRFSSFTLLADIKLAKKESAETGYRVISEEIKVIQALSLFEFTLAIPAFIEERFGVESTLIKEFAVTPLQEVKLFRKIIRPFIEESYGRTSRDSTVGDFYSLRPGVRVLPPKAGSAELSYTVSKVNFAGELIYPMVKEFAKGLNHRVSLNLGISAGKYIFFTGFLRSDKSENSKWDSMISLEASLRI